jgi:hypothetical protein
VFRHTGDVVVPQPRAGVVQFSDESLALAVGGCVGGGALEPLFEAISQYLTEFSISLQPVLRRTGTSYLLLNVEEWAAWGGREAARWCLCISGYRAETIQSKQIYRKPPPREGGESKLQW